MTENLTKQLNSCKIAHAPSLSGMPLDIINRILDKLDPIFRFSLRRVCRNLRNVIDNRDPEIEQVHVLFQSNQSVLTINSTFEFDYNLYAILDDLASLWKNPKLQLKSFYASTSGKHQETVVDSFEEIARLDYQIHCKHFGLYLFEFDDVLTFLPLFKPGILEEIVITTFEQVGNDEAFDIIETEQWKQAKSITLHSMNKLSYFTFPIEDLFHLCKFSVSLEELTVFDALKIRNILLKSVHFEAGQINVKNKIQDDVLRVFNPEFNDNIFRYDNFELTFKLNSLNVKKI
ncbi:F-box domain-containing protein [Caenorhabditis elegans]|uniref:F-box domain-containing protein n=1 Tax=Caenorhabditis elegans TaxID=6239 RepID=Q9XX88_CAEEL|nr:F-box domain-containing protein [Caenorhabditis elegans]CAA20947.1 F-box domain-containing protein [Caenorhabditis elegans]|eukprot:NP_507285.1 F-box A protein [Caenorhabditis elegans]